MEYLNRMAWMGNIRDLADAVERAPEFTRGHKTKAAMLPGINERTLRSRLKAKRTEN